jgi:type IV pilus assembly protein PilP
MYTHFIIIRSAVFLISLSVLFAGIFSGCDSQSEPPRKPEIVYKKIVAKVKGAPESAKTTPGKTATTTLKKPDLVIKPKADISATRDVKISKKPSTVVQKSQRGIFKPKSDISKIKIAKRGKKPVDSSGTNKQLIAQKDTLQPKPDTSKIRNNLSNQKAAKATKKTGKIVSGSLPDTAPGVYVARGKIDPFEPLFKDKPVSRKKRKKRIPRTPLEKLSLGQLKLVAIIRAPSGNKALVEEDSGKGYVIKKGTYIGLNSGKIIKIEKDNIVIEEEIENIQGNIEVRQREMKLQKPSGD